MGSLDVDYRRDNIEWMVEKMLKIMDVFADLSRKWRYIK